MSDILEILEVVREVKQLEDDIVIRKSTGKTCDATFDMMRQYQKLREAKSKLYSFLEVIE